MRIFVRLQVRPERTQVLHLVDVDPDDTVARLLDALGSAEASEFFVGDARLRKDDTIKASPLFDGCVISAEPMPAVLANRLTRGDFTCTVNLPSGRASRYELAIGQVRVGRGGSNDIVIPDLKVSGHHLDLKIEGDRITLTDCASANGTFIDGTEVAKWKAVHLAPGARVKIGDSFLTVSKTAPHGIDIDLERDGEGGFLFNRPSRLREPIESFVVRFPDEIDDREIAFDLLGSALPGATGLAYGSALPLVGTGINVVLQKRRQKTAKKELEERRLALKEELEALEASIDVEVASQRARLLERFPAPHQLLQLLQQPSRRLWERRFGDADEGEVRLGLGTRPADIVFEHRGEPANATARDLEDVPITVDVDAVGVLGIAGPSDRVHATANWLCLQSAFFRPPRDLLIAVLTDFSQRSSWEWLPLLPHSSLERHSTPWMLGNDEASRLSRIAELVAILDERQRLIRDNRDVTFVPQILVVLDGARELRAVPGIVRLLREGPLAGICLIALDDDRSRLPEEAHGELVIDQKGTATFSVDGSRTIRNISLDTPDSGWASQCASLLAPFRLIQSGDSAGIPRSLRFVDMVGIDLEDPALIVEAWRNCGRTTKAWVGASSTDPLIIDLERDGPHALVAGTTGSGKSEFLQTLVASLALANRPDALNFVLVDYKGASAFAECADLPHTVGLVTNLDGHLTQRALASLDAELHRREMILKELHSADINAAWKHAPEQAAAQGLGRLVIVIDEFAELVQELPDFVSGLIRIARVGRSLGVHLVLATQRPTGVVTPEMRANTGLKVALRMEDRADSAEVIDLPNAALISRQTPGRGFVRSSSSGQLVEFQTARVGGGRVRGSDDIVAPTTMRLNWESIGAGPIVESRGNLDTHRQTDLGAICAVIGEAASRLQIPAPRRPWLDPLATVLTLSDLPTSSDHVTLFTTDAHHNVQMSVPIGMIDLPALQDQQEFMFDLSDPGSWGVSGGARSGKTMLLLTIAVALGVQANPADVHFYGLDFGGGGLLPISALPHCGGVFRSAESERLELFVRKLIDEHRRRQGLLSGAGASDLIEYRELLGNHETLPFIVVLVDRWEFIHQEFPPESGSEVQSSLTRLIREGSTTGFRFVVTGDRGLLSDRVLSHLTHRLALRLSDSNDYRILDLKPKNIPVDMPAGRAVRGTDGAEIQFAQPVNPDGGSIRDAVSALAANLGGVHPAGQLRVDPLPERISLPEARQLGRLNVKVTESDVLLGVGGDALSSYSLSLASLRPGFLIAGPRRSGRTSTALLLAAGALDLGWEVVAFSDSALESFGQLSSAVTLLTLDDLVTARPLEDVDTSRATLIVIDGADRFLRTPLDAALVEHVATTSNVKVVVTGGPEELANDLRGIASICKRDQTGIILKPQSPLDGQVFGQRIERSLLGGPAGRGHLFVGGDQLRIQVASLR